MSASELWEVGTLEVLEQERCLVLLQNFPTLASEVSAQELLAQSVAAFEVSHAQELHPQSVAVLNQQDVEQMPVELWVLISLAAFLHAQRV